MYLTFDSYVKFLDKRNLIYFRTTEHYEALDQPDKPNV
jgi:hypothetical protein